MKTIRRKKTENKKKGQWEKEERKTKTENDNHRSKADKLIADARLFLRDCDTAELKRRESLWL